MAGILIGLRPFFYGGRCEITENDKSKNGRINYHPPRAELLKVFTYARLGNLGAIEGIIFPADQAKFACLKSFIMLKR